MPGALQSNQQLFDRIELDHVSGQSGDMMRQPVVIGCLIGDMISRRQVLDNPGGGIDGRGLTASGRGFSFGPI